MTLGESYPKCGELEQIHHAGQPDGHPLRGCVAAVSGHQHLPRVQGGDARGWHTGL